MHLPPYPTFPRLNGEGILLREVMPQDIPTLIPISFYDSEPAATLEEAAGMQTRIDKDYADGNSIHWCIINTLTNQITGTLGYYRGFANNSGELGFVLLPQYRGQGYMSKAMLLALTYGLDVIGLNHIVSITTKQNNAAIQLLTRLGFKPVQEMENDEVLFSLPRD